VISNELIWQNLAPNYEPYLNLFAAADKLDNATLAIIQPRLYNSLERFLLTPTYSPFAVIKALECQSYLSSYHWRLSTIKWKSSLASRR